MKYTTIEIEIPAPEAVPAERLLAMAADEETLEEEVRYCQQHPECWMELEHEECRRLMAA